MDKWKLRKCLKILLHKKYKHLRIKFKKPYKRNYIQNILINHNAIKIQRTKENVPSHSKQKRFENLFNNIQ